MMSETPTRISSEECRISVDSQRIYSSLSFLSAMKIEKILAQYIHALEKGDYESIIELFTNDAVVSSPLYGEIKASQFYRDLLKDTVESKITLLNLFKSTKPVGAAHFLYEWILKDGTVTSFECVDVVQISDDGRIEHLTIIYDTYKTRTAFEGMKVKE